MQLLSSEHIITVTKTGAKINTPMILYRGDKNIEVKILVRNNPFTCNTPNSFAQLIIYNTETYIPTFSDITPYIDNTASFIFEENMLDDLQELGVYKIQLRIYDHDKQSVATLPEIAQALEVRESIGIEEEI